MRPGKIYIAFIALLTSLFVLSGCETLQQNSSGGQVDPRLSNNEDVRFFSKSGWQACAAGAIAGVLLCALLKDQHRTDCMIAAGIAGCGVGMGANYYLDNQRGKYATAEQRLNATIADVRQDNQRLSSLSKTAKDVIASDRRVLEQIQKDMAAGNQDYAAAERELRNIDANIATLQKTLDNLGEREQQWLDVAETERRTGSDTRQLDEEINTMQSQVASLQGELDMLYRQRSAIRLG